jgi:hypothetical protein
MAASAPNGSGELFRVVYSENVRTALRNLLERANARGRLDEFEAAVRTIDSHLQQRPTVFGEPRNDLQQAGLQVRAGSVKPLAVTFAVDEERHLVYVVLPFQPLPGTDI